MKKRYIVMLVLSIIIAIFLGLIIIIKRNNDKSAHTPNLSHEVVEEITENTTEETTEKATEETTEKATEEATEEVEPMKEITDIVFLDRSGTITDDIKGSFIDDVASETYNYMKKIFNYSGYTEEYKNNLLLGMANTEKYPLTKYYYVDEIIIFS